MNAWGVERLEWEYKTGSRWDKGRVVEHEEGHLKLRAIGEVYENIIQ